MVPMDLPEIALKMISTFITKGVFRTGDSKLGVSYKFPLLGTEENRNRHLAALSSKEEAKKEGRKGRFSTQEAATTTASVSNAPTHHYFPTIAYSSALQASVYLRLRLQHSLRSVSSHHSNPNTLTFTPSNKRNHSSNSWISDKDFVISLRHDYVLRIDPGAKALKIEEGWFNKSNLHADLIIEGLIPGIEYSFVIQHNVTTNGLHHVTGGLGTKRVIVAKPGCYHSKFSQCCEHGECSVNEENPANEPTCQCDAGYYGPNCELYSVLTHSPSSSSSSSSATAASTVTAFMKASNLTSHVVCPSRVTIPNSSMKISILYFSSVDEVRDGKIVNLKPCTTDGTTKCCVSIELLVKLSEEMIDTPLRYLENLIANDLKNAVNFIVGYKNLVATDVTMGSEPSIPKLLKGNKHSRSGITGGEGSSTSHLHASSSSSSSRHHANITINRQMPLVLSMCGSPTLVNKVYRDLEMQVKDPTSLINQDVSWRLSSHYYRLVSQKSFSSNEISNYRGETSPSSSSSSTTTTPSLSLNTGSSSLSPPGSTSVAVPAELKTSEAKPQKPSRKKGRFSIFGG
jgi:hypothetical protein